MKRDKRRRRILGERETRIGDARGEPLRERRSRVGRGRRVQDRRLGLEVGETSRLVRIARRSGRVIREFASRNAGDTAATDELRLGEVRLRKRARRKDDADASRRHRARVDIEDHRGHRVARHRAALNQLMKSRERRITRADRPTPAEHMDRAQRDRLDLELGRNAETSAAAAAHRPKKIRLALATRLHHNAIGAHNAHRAHPIASETVRALQIAKSAALRDAAETDGIARSRRQCPTTVASEIAVNLHQSRSGADAKVRATHGRDRVHLREIEHDTIAARRADVRMPARTRRQPHAVRTREDDGACDIVLVGGADNHQRTRGKSGVVEKPRVGIRQVAREDDRAVDSLAKANNRSITDGRTNAVGRDRSGEGTRDPRHIGQRRSHRRATNRPQECPTRVHT